MDLPEAGRLELPLLQEIGTARSRRELAGRLVAHFPQLDGTHLAVPGAARRSWLRLLGRAARRLIDRGELLRAGRDLTLTARGQRRLAEEVLRPDPAPMLGKDPDHHRALQEKLREIGALLGKHAEVEHDSYDVIWRDRRRAPRLSHVFEVQVAGSVDGALARLKRAHEAQRSRLFLVVADERSLRFAEERLRRAFPELDGALQILGAAEVERLHGALSLDREIVTALLGS